MTQICQYAKQDSDGCTCSLTSYDCMSVAERSGGERTASGGKKYNPRIGRYCPVPDLPAKVVEMIRAANFKSGLIERIRGEEARWGQVGFQGNTRKVLQAYLRNLRREQKEQAK